MGNLFARIFKGIHKDISIMMVGLDAAGKSAIVQQLTVGSGTNTLPTLGFQVSTIEYRNISFHVWDIGGQRRFRPMWRYYYNKAGAIIWVMDANDRDPKRFQTCHDLLFEMLDEPMLAGSPLLIFANKQDLPNAMPPAELVEKLGLGSIQNRPWAIYGSCALNGDGLCDGLDWLAGRIRDSQ